MKIDLDETASIAAHIGVAEDDFIQRFTALRPQRDGLALVQRPPAADGTEDHACIFLEGGDCTIQSVKPRQCAGFPNTWNFPGWRESCKAEPALVEHPPRIAT